MITVSSFKYSEETIYKQIYKIICSNIQILFRVIYFENYLASLYYSQDGLRGWLLVQPVLLNAPRIFTSLYIGEVDIEDLIPGSRSYLSPEFSGLMLMNPRICGIDTFLK